MKKFLLEIAQGKKKGLLVLALKPFLCILSALYGIIVRLTYLCYARGILPGYRPRVKVISVGNISLGGTGKTPFVKFLAGYLLKQGRKTAILSRGYSMDEPRLLEQGLPGARVVIGRDRVKSAKKMEDEGWAEVIILDDGFQHWRLKRDLDIVMIDSRIPFGNRRMIPRGILREPLACLRRADIFVLSKADMADNLVLLKEELSVINPGALVIESAHRPAYFYDMEGDKKGLDALRGKDICLLSGIGDPDSFKESVAKLGAGLALIFEFPDHYGYKKEDILKIVELCRGKYIDTIVTTEKDLMRLPCVNFGREVKVLILKMELEVTVNEESLFNRVSGLFAG